MAKTSADKMGANHRRIKREVRQAKRDKLQRRIDAARHPVRTGLRKLRETL